MYVHTTLTYAYVTKEALRVRAFMEVYALDKNGKKVIELLLLLLLSNYHQCIRMKHWISTYDENVSYMSFENFIHQISKL